MKSVLPVVILLAIAVSSVILLKGREINEAGAVASSFMEDVRVINRDSGKHRWTLNAQKVLIPTAGKPARLSDVTIELTEQGMTVDAESGLYYLETRDLTLLGNIVARTKDYTINTESIHIASGSGKLSSPDKVMLVGKRSRIEGEGFEANDDKTLIFKKNVKANFF